MPQSQEHGFQWENFIRVMVFGLISVLNDTNIHDIPCENNKFNCDENISIKCSKDPTPNCGKIMRFFSYDFTKKNTIIVIRYEQNTNTTKKIQRIYEIDYNLELHTLFFGTITKKEIEDYDAFVTSIPAGKEAQRHSKQEREARKKSLQNIHKMLAVINPKVDSKRQRRVQISFNINKIPKNFITYTSPDDKPNLLRGVEIPLTIKSPRRNIRKGITLDKLRTICRVNKDVCRGYSKHTRKESLINFLKDKKLGHIITLHTHFRAWYTYPKI